MELTLTLQEYIKSLKPADLSNERKVVLKSLIDYIQKKLDAKQKVNLNFICTHNSRRSQFSQIWSDTASYYFGFEEVSSFSSGTEVTACNERTISSIKRAGFSVEVDSENEDNPTYLISPSGENKIVVFSKLFNGKEVIKSPFAAVMTCSNAEKNCPYIPDAELRIPVKYEDPKAFDDTDKEERMYDERCKQIAEEMFYVYSQLKK